MDPSYSHSMYNQVAINPAYAGSQDKICFSLLNRKDWFGLGDIAPTVIAVNINSPFRLFGKSHGVGFSITNDRLLADYNTLYSNLSYAYIKEISSGKLGIGINAGIYDISMNNIEFQASDGIEGDDLIPRNGSTGGSSEFNRISFDMGIGLYYKTENLYTGISSTHLLKPKWNSESVTSRIPRHYYLIAGYNLQLSNPLLVFKPSVLAASSGSITKAEFTGIFEYNKKFWGGISYRSGAAIIALFGLELLSGGRFGLAYDLGTNDIGGLSQDGGKGSYEIMFNYCFSLKAPKKVQQYKSIRFL